MVSGSCVLPPRWPPQCSCVVIESSFDPGERLQAPGSLWFEHVTAIMSGNCALNFHRSHFNKILVFFRCFGEIEKLYLFLSFSGIFTGPLRVFLGNMGVFCGILG
jgi:hypothetical protein